MNADGRPWRMLLFAVAWSVIASLALISPVASGPSAPSPGGGATPGPSGSGGGLPPSSAAGASPTGVSLLEGTASWDIDMVRTFFKYARGVDMPAAPAPFPNQDKLKVVNPEFAKRIEALIAVYQASQGGNTDLGIEREHGGLRTNKEQIDLFKECRRIRKVWDPSERPHTPYDQRKGPLVGNGNKKDDWEVIPADERVTARKEIVWTVDDNGVGIMPMKHGSQEEEKKQNCGVFSQRLVRKDPTFGEIYESILGPVTTVWFSWHNVGLAVDLRTSRGVLPGAVTGGAAWANLDHGVEDLGMIHGGWWKSFADVGHVEWHPKLHNSYRFENQGGSALSNDQIDMGYKWKIPSKIYYWAGPPEKAGVSSSLTVLDLVADGNWIAVKKQRHITHSEDGSWAGGWTTFNPPVRLFPAYIPTINFDSTIARDKGSVPPYGETRVTQVYYSAAKTGRSHIETIGGGSYVPAFDVRDFLKYANRAFENKWVSGSEAKWVRFRDAYVYGIRAGARIEPKGSALVRSQSVGGDGYTAENTDVVLHWGGAETGVPCMAWNRDNGNIGGMVVLVQAGKELVYDMKNVTGEEMHQLEKLSGGTLDTPMGCEDVLTYSGQLPSGAWDKENPPEWVPSNPRPERVSPCKGSTGPCLRP